MIHNTDPCYPANDQDCILNINRQLFLVSTLYLSLANWPVGRWWDSLGRWQMRRWQKGRNSKEHPIIKCYFKPCVQSAEYKLHTGGVKLSSLDQLIFLHSWWESNENFLGAASVISKPATCQVSIAGEHFSAAKLVNGIEVVECWKHLLSTRAWHPIRFST